MERKEYLLKVIETAATVVGVAGALGGALWGYLDYREKAELQALRGLHDAQMTTCNEVAATTAKLLSASNQDEFDDALAKYGEVKHGKALLILDKRTLDTMVRLWNKAIDINVAEDSGEFGDAVMRSLGNLPFEVVLSCRKMLASGFEEEGKTQIEEIEDGYVMTWSQPDAPKTVRAKSNLRRP